MPSNMLNTFILSLRLWRPESLAFNLKMWSFSRGVVWMPKTICDSDFPHCFENDDMVKIVILLLEDTDELGLELMNAPDVSY